MRQLAESKAKTAQLVDAVYRAARDAASTLVIPPVPKPRPDPRRRDAEIAVAIASDWQLAKVTKSYNSKVCEERIERYAEKVLKLTDIQRADHPVREARLWCLGDLIEGSDIFPGQPYLIDASLYRQVVVDGPRILGNLIRRLLSSFDRLTVTAVPGNHGRIGRKGDHDGETNADRMLYRITQQLFTTEPRVTWNIPEGKGERGWYAVDVIGKYSCLLIHGDQFRTTAGMPWYSLQKKIGGWKMGALPFDFSEVAFGHYHQPTRVTLNTVTARCSGSTESHNDFAAEQLAAVGRPSQWLLFVLPSKGMVTAEYVVWLD